MPDFVIIGAMKCATSTLHDQLARLPGVSMSEPKEPNFFSDDANWQRGIGWYKGLFESMPAGDLKGESSTHYTKLPAYPDCAARMAENLPDARLVYVMRDPIDRIVSQYIHEWSQRVIDDGCTIDDAIRAHPMLIDYSRYAMQLTPFIERFGYERILPVFFERLMGDPQPEFERIGRFLGITTPMRWETAPAQNISSERQRRGPLVDAVLGVPLLQKLRRAVVPESVRARIRSQWTMPQRPQLSPGSIDYLHDLLDPDMRNLGEMLGITLTCSGFKHAVVSGGAPEWRSAVSA